MQSNYKELVLVNPYNGPTGILPFRVDLVKEKLLCNFLKTEEL
jgi:hypothetical protein